MDAQIKEIKDLCVANGSKDAEIAALKEQLSKLLTETGLQINEVRKFFILDREKFFILDRGYPLA